MRDWMQGVATHEHNGLTHVGRAEDCNGHHEVRPAHPMRCTCRECWANVERGVAADLANYGQLL